MAQEAYTVLGVLNKGHPLDLSQSTTHAVTTLCLYKPWWQQQKLLCERSQEGEMKTCYPQTLTPTTRTLSISETHSTLHLDEHLEALEGLEDLEGLEALED